VENELKQDDPEAPMLNRVLRAFPPASNLQRWITALAALGIGSLRHPDSKILTSKSFCFGRPVLMPISGKLRPASGFARFAWAVSSNSFSFTGSACNWGEDLVQGRPGGWARQAHPGSESMKEESAGLLGDPAWKLNAQGEVDLPLTRSLPIAQGRVSVTRCKMAPSLGRDRKRRWAVHALWWRVKLLAEEPGLKPSTLKGLRNKSLRQGGHQRHRHPAPESIPRLPPVGRQNRHRRRPPAGRTTPVGRL